MCIRDSLKPGMTVSVEIFLSKHSDVVTAPVASILELDEKFYCWVDTGGDLPEKREVVVSDHNDTFAMLAEGVQAGDQVVLNPRDFVDEASTAVLKSIEQKAAPEEVPEFDASKAEGRKKEDKSANPIADQIMKAADKNKDGVLTEDEMDEKGKKTFKSNDTNSDGKIDRKELDAAIKKAMAAGGKKK